MRDERLVALWVPDWPVLAAMSQEKLSEHQPVATINSRQTTAVSAVARSQGLRRGMRLRTARSICPDVVFITDDPPRDARLFERVLTAVDDVVVGVEIVRPGLLVLPVAGPLRHWGDEELLAEQLITAVAHHTGWESAVGVGEGLLGAVSAARRSRLIPQGHTREFLHPLPIEELLQAGIASVELRPKLEQLVDLLVRLGIRTLGQFSDLSFSDVSARFGPVGNWAHHLVTNRAIARGTPGKVAPELSAFLNIDPPAQRVDQAAFAARKVATELHEKLIAAGLTCARLHIGVRSEVGNELQRTWRYEGELTASEITDRVRWQLEGWISGRSGQSPDAGLDYLVLTALDLSPGGNAQGELWGTTSKKDHHAHRSLTRVQHLLGPTGVFRPVLEGGRSPQQQVRLVAWGDELTPLRDPKLPWPGRLPTPAPSLVYPKPVPVLVTDAQGRELQISARGELNTAPYWLISRPAGRNEAKNSRKRISGWAGPWFIAERWWEGNSPRARFQLLLEDQHAVLVAYQERRWLVEASYD